MSMTRLPPTRGHAQWPLSASAVLVSAALVAAVGLLCVLVHVLNEQVQSGELRRQQFRLMGTAATPVGKARQAADSKPAPARAVPLVASI